MSPRQDSGAHFHSTQWSVILAARDGESTGSAAATTSLCATYWRPLYSFARRKGHSVEDAQDLAQGFFSQLLEKNSLRRVDPALGKFRSFLLAAFGNFMAGEWRRGHAAKRGGTVPLVGIEDMTRAEDSYVAAQSQTRTPEQVYERNWALALLERTTTRLEGEFDAAGKARVFRLLKPYLTGEHEGTPYSEVAAQLEMNEVTARVAVHRMRGRFHDLLRDEVARTLPDPADSRAIMDELRYLLSVL